MNFRDIVYPVGVLAWRGNVIFKFLFYFFTWFAPLDIPFEEPRIITSTPTKTGQTAPASPKCRSREGKGGIQK